MEGCMSAFNTVATHLLWHFSKIDWNFPCLPSVIWVLLQPYTLPKIFCEKCILPSVIYFRQVCPWCACFWSSDHLSMLLCTLEYFESWTFLIRRRKLWILIWHLIDYPQFIARVVVHLASCMEHLAFSLECLTPTGMRPSHLSRELCHLFSTCSTVLWPEPCKLTLVTWKALHNLTLDVISGQFLLLPSIARLLFAC